MKIDERILVGGNHLATALLSQGITPSSWISYDEILKGCGQPWADIWCAWKAIMDVRNECETK